jgi:hypothetical protein
MSCEKKTKRERGLSLIESLICMTLFLVIVLGTLEAFSVSQRHFFKLKDDLETDLAARSALDKIKIDLQACGQGLFDFSPPGLIEPLAVKDNTLTLRRAEERFALAGVLVSGQIRIPLVDTKKITKGKEICLCDGEKGEIKTVSSKEKTGVILSSPLKNSYSPDSTVILIYKLFFYLDKNKDVLRRKVNASPAQPLCEQVKSFACTYDARSNLVQLRLSLLEAPEKFHETFFYPKNTGLAALRRHQ